MSPVNTAACWIETFTGRRFPLLEPRAEDIDIRDIAHALSMQVRYTGHVRKFYSVAEHCCHVSHRVPAEDALWGLLHDASEAYIADLSRPLKHASPLGPIYLEIEDRIMRAVCEHFGLPLTLPMPASVKAADNLLLLAEKQALMTSLPWDATAEAGAGLDGPSELARISREAQLADIALFCYRPEIAEEAFLRRFDALISAVVVDAPSNTR